MLIIGRRGMTLFFRIFIKIFLTLIILAGCATTEEIKETDPIALFKQGTALLYLEGQVDRSIRYFNKAIEIDPNYASAYINRGFAYEIKSQHYKACSDYKRACQLSGVCGAMNRAKAQGWCE